MSVTYSLYRPNFTSLDTSTRATVTSNEGALAASAGSPATFTFAVPDGLWSLAQVLVTVESVSQANVPVLFTSDMGNGNSGQKHGATGNARWDYQLGDNLPAGVGTPPGSDGSINTVYLPLDGLATGTVSGYPCYASLTSGGQASVTLEINEAAAQAGSELSGVSAVMTLQSITPAPPYADFSGQSSPGGPPYAGSATAALPPTYGLVGPTPDGETPNGVPPYTYRWQNVPQSGGSASTSSGGTASPGDALSDSWSFASINEEAGGSVVVNVSVGLVNSPYPHQVDAPRSAGFGGSFAYKYGGPLSFITPNAAYALSEDAHRRPVALTPNRAGPLNFVPGPSGLFATSINGLVSNDAGRTYLENYVSDVGVAGGANFGADNPSLLVDRRSNHYRAVYSRTWTGTVYGEPGSTPSVALLLATGLFDDRFSQVAGSPAVIAGLSGGLCVAAQHPTDPDYALLVYSDTGTSAAPGSHDMKAAQSLDAGASWKPLPTILPALDLSQTGRPALCWLGNTAILVYSAGTTLSALTSADRGQTWQKAGPVSTYTPGGAGFAYFCLSLAAHGGQVYLLAFVGDTQAKGATPATSLAPPQTSPRLFVSGTGGQMWALRAAETPGTSSGPPVFGVTQVNSAPPEYAAPPPGVLPAIQAPSGLGISPASGLMRLDTTYVSHNGGLTWAGSALQ